MARPLVNIGNLETNMAEKPTFRRLLGHLEKFQKRLIANFHEDAVALTI